jgi:carbonyl reductase 1
VSNTIRVNFTGTLNVCNELFPLIRENGKVVNISSRMGLLKVIQDDNLRALLNSQSLTVKELCLIMNDYVKLVLY